MDDVQAPPSLFEAAWRYRRMVAIIVGLALLLGLIIANVRNGRSDFGAEAAVIVEDPNASALFESGSVGRPDRYLENQIEIMSSLPVASRAKELGGSALADIASDEGMIGRTRISSSGGSDAIRINFRARDADTAIAGANAVANAYEAIKLDASAERFRASIDELAVSIEENEEELTRTRWDMEMALRNSSARSDLLTQYEEALQEVSSLQASLKSAPATTAADIRARLEDLQVQLRTLDAVLAIEVRTTEMEALSARLTAAESRLGRLVELRDQLEVDANLASSGVVFVSPATSAARLGASMFRALAVSGILGGLLALALAYSFTLRDRTNPAMT